MQLTLESGLQSTISELNACRAMLTPIEEALEDLLAGRRPPDGATALQGIDLLAQRLADLEQFLRAASPFSIGTPPLPPSALDGVKLAVTRRAFGVITPSPQVEVDLF